MSHHHSILSAVAALATIALIGLSTTVPSWAQAFNKASPGPQTIGGPLGAAVAAPAPGVVNVPVPGAAPALVTVPNVVAPASSGISTFSLGDLAGQVLTWLAAAFSVPLGALATLYVKRLFNLAGIKMSQEMSNQLDETLVNGLNDAAHKATTTLAGRDPVTIRNVIVQDAVNYAVAHRAETISALGLDPQSGDTVAVLRARIEKLITDQTEPTPPVLDPPNPPKTNTSPPADLQPVV